MESRFPVQPRERLNIDVAIRNRLVAVRGEVVYVIPTEDETFHLGVSIRETRNRDRIPVGWLTGELMDRGHREGGDTIIRMGQIICPNCKQQIASVDRIKAMLAYCSEYLGRCRCGLQYEIRVSSYGSASFTFPDRQIELLC
jgi:hypothetical protein